MGRSSPCLKIITCGGGDTADKDDLHVSEAEMIDDPNKIALQNENSSDKHGWSFWKRSASHRVLNNTVISEVPSSVSKESPESANLKSRVPDTSIVQEKASVIQCTDGKLQLSTSTEQKVSEKIVVSDKIVVTQDEVKVPEMPIITKDEGKSDTRPKESVVIILQTAVRVFLAKSKLFKLKNVIKLQAAVRGHIVRRHAVGTLRCVQAIVKIQALVRARRSRLLLDSCAKKKDKENQLTKPIVTYTSIEKLLSNSFAQQLIASTPKTKPIHIKCDPMKPSPAWSWLERWMSVSSAQQTPNTQLETKELEIEKNDSSSSPMESRVTPKDFPESAHSSSETRETIVLSDSDENLITLNADNMESHTTYPSSSVFKDLDQHHPKVTVTSDVKDTSTGTNTFANQSEHIGLSSRMGPSSLSLEEIESEQSEHTKCSTKRFASEKVGTEAKKSNIGSTKSSNPAFIAVQSKFAELSSTVNSNRSTSSPYQEGEFEPNSDVVSSGEGNIARENELNVIENLAPQNPRVQYGGSECGTELSITSTLDSPDLSEIGAVEEEHEAKVPGEETSKPNGKDDVIVQVKNEYIEPAPNLAHTVMKEPKKINDIIGELAKSKPAEDSTQAELQPETSACDTKKELDSVTGGQAYRLSPEVSPRSHISIPDCDGTPSSQISVAGKKSNTQRGSSNQKRKSLSAGKRSSNLHDSNTRSSTEQLPEDEKNGKRRNSFGSTRPEPTDQEPRDSSSSGISIPHFMHATESARAKFHANNSPRSSPDVHDTDYIKKRHSLPGADRRQGSPRIQRSLSQAQQGKGNSSHVVHGICIASLLLVSIALHLHALVGYYPRESYPYSLILSSTQTS
ncbi:hypothetical protein K2173_027818 [Erythroxylum novogranatense]|uniref:DUF4005 domain-containing protein n=1 Tax=Erythroxylum novogranatense TaxID=1862640 RepID=A0AAV8U062_9ROSI|nr:hypothetical protein K2173_027818 [Erythroxylum novogranatense]